MILLFRHLCRAQAEIPLIFLSKFAEPPLCLVEQSVNAALTDAFDAAEQMLLSRFAEVKLSDIARDFDLRFRNLNEEPARVI